MDAGGDRLQPVRSVIDRVHRRDVRQQRLRGADVRRRLLAADVLLAGLERHPVRLASPRVHRQADDSPRRLADERLPRREERRVRSAVPERHAEPLRVADDDVGAHLSGRSDQRQRHQIARHGDEQARRMGLVDRRPQIGDRPAIVRVLQQQAERVLHRDARRVADLEPDVERLGPAAQDVDRLRETAVRDEEHALLPCRRLLRLQPVEHRHGLGRRGALVEQRRRRDVHPGQVLHDRLEIEERFEPALRDLRLIRRVRRVPAGILEDVAKDHARRDAVVVAHADVRPGDGVARRDAAQPAQIPVLGVGFGQIEGAAAPDAGRDRLIDQRVERRHADRAKHPVPLRGVRADVPMLEGALRVGGHRGRFLNG